MPLQCFYYSHVFFDGLLYAFGIMSENNEPKHVHHRILILDSTSYPAFFLTLDKLCMKSLIIFWIIYGALEIFQGCDIRYRGGYIFRAGLFPEFL